MNIVYYDFSIGLSGYIYEEGTMFLFALCILILNIKPSVSHFPEHSDLQKVGDIIFNNEKYKVLKVSTHRMTDYFEDFMLGRKNTNPNRKLLVDDNGFRHEWSGFEKKSRSLRKTEIISMDVDTETDFKENIADKNENPTSIKSSSASTNEQNDTLKSVGNIKDNKSGLGTANAAVKDTSSASLRGDHDKPEKKNNLEPTTTAEPLRQGGKKRTVGKTTFFCPFLGVITMTAFLD